MKNLNAAVPKLKVVMINKNGRDHLSLSKHAIKSHEKHYISWKFRLNDLSSLNS